MFLKTEKLIYYLKIEIFLKFYLYQNKNGKKKRVYIKFREDCLIFEY